MVHLASFWRVDVSLVASRLAHDKNGVIAVSTSSRINAPLFRSSSVPTSGRSS